MSNLRPLAGRTAYLATLASAAIVLVTIKSEILLALALAALVAAGGPFRLPPVKVPLTLFWLGTFLSLAASPEPKAGLPQIYKIFLFSMLLVVASTFRREKDGRRLVLAWAGLGSASALWSFVQFASKTAAGAGYGQHVVSRTTGFMSHWMTFGGEVMIVLTMVLALLLLGAPGRRLRWALWGAAAVLGYALLLNGTRNAWAGAGIGAMYVIARWRPRWALALPLVAAIAILVGPPFVRERVWSLARPHGELDSNQHRIVTFRTGLRMIEAHPWLGVGPERVGRTFRQYLPPDVPLPLPDGFYGHLHNVYLQVAAERGIPVLLCLLWFFGRLLWDFTRPATGTPWLVHGACGVVLAVMIAGLAEHNLGDSEVLMMFLAAVGLGYTGRGNLSEIPVSNASEVV